MELVSTGWHVISATLVFLAGAVISIRVGRALDTSNRRALILYLWHTLFCLANALFVLESGGDALMYYGTSWSSGVDFSFGTAAVQLITVFFSSVLGLSILGTFLCYNLFGSIGLLAFDATLRSATADKGRQVRQLATLVVFLPSVSFWSSAIGKDALSFMAAGLALWAAQNLKRRSWLMAVAIALMLLVRPHIAALMVMAVAFSMMIQPRVPLLRRIAVGGLGLGMATILVPLAMDTFGLGSGARVTDVADYVVSRQSYNMEGGGGVDISAMPLPLKLFTYLFRPLPFEAHSIPALAASIDNLLLMFLMLVGTWQMIKRRRANAGPNRAFLWIYALSAWLVLSLTTANLGISVRQKWMFAPMLIFLFISVIGKSRNRVSGTHNGTAASVVRPRDTV